MYIRYGRPFILPVFPVHPDGTTAIMLRSDGRTVNLYSPLPAGLDYILADIPLTIVCPD